MDSSKRERKGGDVTKFGLVTRVSCLAAETALFTCVLCVCSFVCFSFLQFECGFIMVYSVFRKQKYHTKVSDFNVIYKKKAFLFLFSFL